MDTYKERLMEAPKIGAQDLIQMQDNEFLGYLVPCMGQ